MDVSTCLDLVLSGAAVVLAQGTWRPVPGIVLVPLAGVPLTWMHFVGWHPQGAAAEASEDVVTHATAAYRETVDARPRYAAWLRDHPRFGALPVA
jgi:hypothetical protein